MSATKANPYTCRHKVGSVEYMPNGAQCQDCGRKWYVWTSPEGHKMYLTEPRFAKKGSK